MIALTQLIENEEVLPIVAEGIGVQRSDNQQVHKRNHDFRKLYLRNFMMSTCVMKLKPKSCFDEVRSVLQE